MQSMTTFGIAVGIHLKYGPLTKRTPAKATLFEMCCLHANLLRDILTYILYDENKETNKHTKKFIEKQSPHYRISHALFTNQIKFKHMY